MLHIEFDPDGNCGSLKDLPFKVYDTGDDCMIAAFRIKAEAEQYATQLQEAVEIFGQ